MDSLRRVLRRIHDAKKEKRLLKNLDFYIHFRDITDKNHLSLIQPETSGGSISNDTIDSIEQHPSVSEISISGLKQKTFEYFISKYGNRFRVITFWKCPLVEDLSGIAKLKNVEYLIFFWNQRAVRLWDFSKTAHLRGLAFNDFTRMHSLSDLSKSSSLEELNFGGIILSRYILESFKPLVRCKSLKRLIFSIKQITDKDISSLAKLQGLIEIEFPSNQFTTEQIAWLKARLPIEIKSTVLAPFQRLRQPLTTSDNISKDILINGKRKPFLNSNSDKKVIDKYVRNFETLVKQFSASPKSPPPT